jgi:hypothetical protein
MTEKNSGERILKYTDLKADRLGNKCAIWYKNLNLPENIKVDFPDCCLMFNKNDMNHFICSSGNRHCLKKSRIIMKTINEGCIRNSSGLILDGFHDTIDTPESNNPNTEILG